MFNRFRHLKSALNRNLRLSLAHEVGDHWRGLWDELQLGLNKKKKYWPS